jgi:HupE / UreJ protein
MSPVSFRLLLACALSAAPVLAHAVSMSTGELRVDGRLAVYELRIPSYEVSHAANPDTALLDHIRLIGARRIASECHAEADNYVCIANYAFPGAADLVVDSVDVECTLYQITVPNHVHLLRVIQGAKSDQVVFDQTKSRAEVRFRPLSAIDSLLRGLAEGMWRAIASPAALFLLALVVAARSARESVVLTCMYLAGEWVMRAIAPRIPWPLSPRFVEAAMALTVAYLAIEILMLPNAGKRWAVVFALGIFHGLYFAPLPAAYLAGASLMQAIVVAVLTEVALKWLTGSLRRLSAIVLLIGGAGWFVVRLLQTN